jgi:membrane-associated phospholipid phosphatase
VLFVFVRRHGAYRRLRNTLITLDAIGLVGYWLYPTAPPRLTPGYGFVDTLDPSGTHLRSSLVGSLTNLYAAVPSLHTAYALAVGITGYGVARTLAGRVAACAYPLLVVFATVATGNHWFLDAVAGAGALALAWLIVSMLDRVRPQPR